jgi:DNA-binding transcriptional ArsR family regulator
MMRTGPDIAYIAALLGDPARANMLTALLDGGALTAGELAREAGVSAQTASSHLAKLGQGGLVEARSQGRHRYYALAGDEVAQVLEGLMGLAERSGLKRSRPGPREPELRRARVCYDHLAGELGVAMLEGLIASGRIRSSGGELALTATGEAFAADFGLDLQGLREGRRPVCRGCLDWSVRRTHLAGGLGAALLQRIYQLGWARRLAGARVVTFTLQGLADFEAAFAAPAA